MNSLKGNSRQSFLTQLLPAVILSVFLLACGGGGGGGTPDDLTPNAFTFTAQTDVELSTVVESNAITVSSINQPVSISISGGEYSIAGGNYTSATGTISNGQSVTVRLTSSENYSTQTDATLTIGGVSGTFSVTTLDDTFPDAFSFEAQTEVEVSTQVTSNEVTITGLAAASPISITGGEYSIDGGEFSDAEGSIENDQTVVVRQTSSTDPETTTEAILTIGGVEGSFAVTTPGKYNFEGFTGVALNARLQTHIVTIDDIGDSTPISIENGEYQLDRGAWTDQAGFIDNGQEVRVRANAGSDYSVTTTARLNVGDSWGLFNVTTKEHGNFISVWKTDNPGTSDDNQITLPLEADGNYDFTVDWGDGTTSQITQWDQAEVTHTYANAGEYTVTISGEFVGFRFNNSGDADKLIDIQHWGSLRLGNNGRAFTGANNFQFSGTDALDLTDVTDLSATFHVSFIGEFGSPFNGYIENWDVSEVTNFESFFRGVKEFNKSLSRWDVSSAQNMEGMFANATLREMDISQWDVSSVENMEQFLFGASLTTENYSKALNAWSRLSSLKLDVTLDASSNFYNSSAVEARALIIDSFNWVINDAGLEPQ